eukprot:2625771-Pleurochrysis_carterae.AAC.1
MPNADVVRLKSDVGRGGHLALARERHEVDVGGERQLRRAQLAPALPVSTQGFRKSKCDNTQAA